MVAAKTTAFVRFVLTRVALTRTRPSRRIGLVVISAVGVCLCVSLTASVGVRAATAGRVAVPASLSARLISLRTVSGRIVASATVSNSGNAPVRSTTAVLGLVRGSGDRATGLLEFSVPSLAPGSSRRLRLTTPPIHGLHVAPGTYTALVCTDIYSQIGRFAQTANCSSGGRLAISTAGVPRPSGAAPNTIIRSAPAGVSRSSSAAFRFVSTVRHSTFECSLDHAPWFPCTSPHSYKGLVDGRHDFAVRAIGPTGILDATLAHASWTVDALPPVVTLATPVSGSTTTNSRPLFSGMAGTAAGDSSTVTVNVFSGSNTSGLPVQTLAATLAGSQWSVTPTTALANGSYTAQAEQTDSAGNTGVSTPSIFTIDAPPQSTAGSVGVAGATETTTPASPPPPPSTYSVGGSVSGLSGTVVLRDNGEDDLSVKSDGAFTFATRLVDGAGYDVSVETNPSGQTCTVSGGSGTVASANVTGVAVTCADSPPPPPSTYSVGGSVSGLSGTVVLRDNGEDDLSVKSDGAFTFATRLVDGAGYDVSVETNPSGQTCTVSGGPGRSRPRT